MPDQIKRILIRSIENSFSLHTIPQSCDRCVYNHEKVEEIFVEVEANTFFHIHENHRFGS